MDMCEKEKLNSQYGIMIEDKFKRIVEEELGFEITDKEYQEIMKIYRDLGEKRRYEMRKELVIGESARIDLWRACDKFKEIKGDGKNVC